MSTSCWSSISIKAALVVLAVAMAVAPFRQIQVLPPCSAFQSVNSGIIVCGGGRSPARQKAAVQYSSATGMAFVRGSASSNPPRSLSLPTVTSLSATTDGDPSDGTASSDNKKPARKKSSTKKKSSAKSSSKPRVTANTKGETVEMPVPDPPVAVSEGTPPSEDDNGDESGGTVDGTSKAEVVPIPVAQLAAAQREAEQKMHAAKRAAIEANTSPDGTYYGPRPRAPDILQFDVTGGRPGAIIESEDELERKRIIFEELESGKRKYEEEWLADYGYFEQEVDAKYTTDDPDAIDASTLGQYDITDLNTKFDWEWDPNTDPDPNRIPADDGRFLAETEKDEEGIEKGYDPYFGPSNPIDERTKIGTVDSYMVDERTRDEKMLTPQFHPGDPEIAFNEDVVQYRKSMDIIETYVDKFLPEDLPVPRNVAKWYGYPEPMRYPQKNYTNNRFTKPEHLTNFDELTPFRARQKAVELARANNAEWLPVGVSQAWHQEQRRPYEEVGTLVGTLRPGKIDEEIREAIQPALKVLGSCAILLSIEAEGKVFRFHYHGLMKNRAGMEAWTETLIRDCGVEVTGVVFETGFRTRDPLYDGGDPYHGWN